MSDTKKEEISFEEAMNELENVVEQLEQGDVPLDEAISMFQKGMELSKQCHDKLEQVEKKMDRILHPDGEIEEVQLVEDEG
ncbi:exodeoxyribonuclease VII small subunit [Alkalihalobacillus alcalophilus ATCC 27647 = CGMCC 1.3604]|uniref:Exodeoxyribonuclease 7 small subunit n=1 Tax=Alkalihalobacillus alcalophilus ATCC 27647 = CGMCC 1.3604 TaxID=1218173 RepID=A0A094WPG3_ALKAL|nr:exodeoxyribonuclease VII small subunit [Alkalihalobacillus alcalophilus]KGA97898.1 exodeoxyribonuclease VII small subunit [Alkalihalobacillus alcalophilus ATCC 27647 = CGMCC 1.3604]MED1561485.1 exodeoxyribonuclease VII small subunit [Alkalihalobacillus alcalophilus]THG88423.1 exodeoxyribonuclease VII small subunit [Alkalihalobacillus alcalophilus ATCC 27647 = CGMCC 1.3604]